MSEANDNTYYIAFGKFIHWYARVEGATHGLFEWCSGLTQEEARSITNGQRLKDVMSMTRRLASLRKSADVCNEINTIFDQLLILTELRHLLIHRGAEIFGDMASITNIRTAKSKADWQVLDIKIAEIRDAAHDCSFIWIRIKELINPDPDSYWQHGDAAKALAQPWRYKHRAPRFPHRAPNQIPATGQARKHQPRSSPS
jgi:hypothetical protein